MFCGSHEGCTPVPIELLSTVRILIVALGNQVKPLVWPGREALQNADMRMILLRVAGVVLEALLKCNMRCCHPSFHS